MFIDKLQLNSIENRPYHIQMISSINMQGVKEGFNWLLSNLPATLEESAPEPMGGLSTPPLSPNDSE